MTAGATVPFAELRAPAAWAQIDFISDLHLAPDMPLTLAAWSAYLLATPADAVFVLGDMFDVWVGDDARGDAFEAHCTDVLAQAARRCHIAFMAGNRDFLVGPQMLAACSADALADPTVVQAFGQRVLLTHGDALCLADTEYQRYRTQVRSPAWQAAALALPLAERRRLAAQMRHASEQRGANGLLPAQAADIDRTTALAWLREACAPVLIHGHTHKPGDETLAPGLVRHVLSDWDLDRSERAEVLRWTARGMARLSPAQAMQAAP